MYIIWLLCDYYMVTIWLMMMVNIWLMMMVNIWLMMMVNIWLMMVNNNLVGGGALPL